MPETTLLFLLLALIVSFVLAGFQYFYKPKGSLSQKIVLSSLRFIAILSLLILLINPKIDNKEYFIEKPDLVLAVDNSSSIKHFGEEDKVRELVNLFATDEALSERFDLHIFRFGREVTNKNEFNFLDTQTNIPAALKELNRLYENKTAPTILITDGNQTLGEDYGFVAQNYSQPILPVLVGDTTDYQDLEISRVNTNKYAFQNNFFPVEVMVNYRGKQAVTSRLQIRTGNVTVYSEEVNFDLENRTRVINASLPSVAVGVSNYEVRLRALPDEKNVENNRKEFALEVIDERTKVLLAYKVLHPDLGALKKSIEANQQREVELVQISKFSGAVGDYQLVLLYQPDAGFQEIMGQLQESGRNMMVITGPETDWRFLNAQQEIFQQEISAQQEEYFPVYNPNFSLFQTEDIAFKSFPPLKGSFGNLSSLEGVETILFRQVQGIKTEDPLLAVAEKDDIRTAFLFGADIWKWRAQVYQENESFEAFDTFIGKLVQFLTSQKSRERLEVNYEPLYYGSENLSIAAEYFDRNYVFDPGGRLELRLKNEETGDVQQIPFTFEGSRYEVDLSNLKAGTYSFKASVEGESLSRSGNFRLLDFDVEQQFVRANLEGLQGIANNKGQDLYFLADFASIKKNLLNEDSYKPVQKSRINDVPLIEWFYLLGIIVVVLSLEWFLRKYYGLI